MSTYTTPRWGFKILTENSINFYHVLLPKIHLNSLHNILPQARSIQKQKDGSITISVPSSENPSRVVREIVSYLKEKEKDFLSSPDFYYKMGNSTRQSLRAWALSFEGCLGILLTSDKAIQPLLENATWQFINSKVGGLYLAPFTLFLYEDHPKIIHPITIQNEAAREEIERITAQYIKSMVKRVEQAQNGFEGLALISYVEEKTGLTQEQIADHIHEKTAHVETPHYSPLFAL